MGGVIAADEKKTLQFALVCALRIIESCFKAASVALNLQRLTDNRAGFFHRAP
jgi:hypothetical protein